MLKNYLTLIFILIPLILFSQKRQIKKGIKNGQDVLGLYEAKLNNPYPIEELSKHLKDMGFQLMFYWDDYFAKFGSYEKAPNKIAFTELNKVNEFKKIESTFQDISRLISIVEDNNTLKVFNNFSNAFKVVFHHKGNIIEEVLLPNRFKSFESKTINLGSLNYDSDIKFTILYDHETYALDVEYAQEQMRMRERAHKQEAREQAILDFVRTNPLIDLNFKAINFFSALKNGDDIIIDLNTYLPSEDDFYKNYVDLKLEEIDNKYYRQLAKATTEGFISYHKQISKEINNDDFLKFLDNCLKLLNRNDLSEKYSLRLSQYLLIQDLLE